MSRSKDGHPKVPRTSHTLDMRTTCAHVIRMKMVQIRNVPEKLHATLKSRAALSGLSLSDYLLREMARVAERPTPDELRDRLEAHVPAHLREAPADAVRAERDSR